MKRMNADGTKKLSALIGVDLRLEMNFPDSAE
jgi:hypothetical protein